MLSCPSCRTPFLPDTIDKELGLAQCGACDAVSERDRWLELEPEASEPEEPSEAEKPPSRAPLQRVRSTVFAGWIEAEGAHFLLKHAWIRSIKPWPACFTTAIAFFLFPGFEGLWMSLFSPLSWLWWGAIYYLLVTAVNTTTVEISGGRLRVRHQPLPWRRGASVSIRSITFVLVRPLHNYSDGGGEPTPTWELVARVQGGDETVLIRACAVEEELNWLKHRITSEIRFLVQQE